MYTGPELNELLCDLTETGRIDKAIGSSPHIVQSMLDSRALYQVTEQVVDRLRTSYRTAWSWWHFEAVETDQGHVLIWQRGREYFCRKLTSHDLKRLRRSQASRRRVATDGRSVRNLAPSL